MPKCLVVAALLLLANANSARADIGRGKELSEQLCAQCHAVVPGQASPNPKAPTFERSAADPTITVYSLRAFLRTPHATMPNIIVKPDDVDDIAEYLLSLKPKQ
ncbi:MAG TPA: cytochrome c [Stellaceae bacterium]|nr:cytochrome c [Stellaceae bacterium]